MRRRRGLRLSAWARWLARLSVRRRRGLRLFGMGAVAYRDEPATPEQLVAALVALGAYSGKGDAAEHAAEAERLGADVYRVQLANALLGCAQVEALLCEQLGLKGDKLRAAHRQQLLSGGVMDPGSEVPNPEKLAEFLRWQALRVGGPLREIAQDPSTGPVPLAAAHAADGLQRLLGVIAAGQVPDIGKVRDSLAEMRTARECFEATIANIDILTSMLGGLEALFDD